MSLQRTVRTQNIRDPYIGINDFKKGQQPRSNLVKDENGDLLADSHYILNRWKNYFSQLLNVYSASDVRQIDIHNAEQLVPDPSPFYDEIQAGGEILRSKIHKLINSILNKEELPNQWKESIIVPVHKKGDKTD
jgi:hypothetical protein